MQDVQWFPGGNLESVGLAGNATAAPSSRLVTVTLTPASTPPFVVPALVTSLNVKCWGPGGNGGNAEPTGPGCGGGGGAYAESDLAVTPGDSIDYLVAAGGSEGLTTWGAGPDVEAEGGGNGDWGAGSFGAGGSSTIGDIANDGGDGGDVDDGASKGGGGGGGVAGPTGGGGNGVISSGTTGGAGGNSDLGAPSGGHGGSSTTVGSDGVYPGGGGGGGGSAGGGHSGGLGAAGRIDVTYTAPL